MWGARKCDASGVRLLENPRRMYWKLDLEVPTCKDLRVERSRQKSRKSKGLGRVGRNKEASRTRKTASTAGVEGSMSGVREGGGR